MKKAVIVGGSNGIGLAIGKKLINMGYYIYIVDRCEPDEKELSGDKFTYFRCNLLDFQEKIFTDLAADKDVNALIITAGFGRVAGFEYLHIADVENLMRVNAIAGIKIINIFFHRIMNNSLFYTGVLGSIAGLLSSPLFSVYAASKAAICRFVESVNIELAMSDTQNRILNISPASIQGTRFNGGPNEPDKLKELAEEILDRLFKCEELYIPKYEETYKAVLERYHSNPTEYGLHSYQYKMESGRVKNKKETKIGYLSGTFDLFHIGHLNLLHRAKEQCDYLIVGVHNSGARKGKETFIPLEDRKEIVGACKYVDKVVDACIEDSDAWNLWHYNLLFVGSDYKGTERFQRYEEFFKDKEVEIIYFPYTQRISSSQLREEISTQKD